MTFKELTNVPILELLETDWPFSIGGNRPIEKLQVQPRKRKVIVQVSGDRYVFGFDHVVKRVRRPVMASIQYVRTFDPADTQVR